MFGLQRDPLLNSQVINASTKGGDGSAIRKGMKLMKRRLYFKIIAKLGNSNRQHCSRQKYIYIYIYMNIYVCVRQGPLFKKPSKKKKMERQKGQGSLLFTYEPQEHFICLVG